MLLTLYFLLTIAIEIPIAIIFFKKKQRGDAARTCLMLNLFTWPILHILYYTINIETSLDIIKLQAGVTIMEGFGYWIMMKCGWKKGFFIAIIANGFTYGIGLLLNHPIL